MTTLCTTDLYHTGIIVADVEAAMQELTDVAGYRWMKPVTHPVPIWTPAGESTVTITMVYSHDEHRLELIQEIPGTTWVRSPGSAIHHIGYFVDDVAAASAALTASGLPVEACAGMQPDGRPAGFAYHLTADGIRIEVANRSVIEQMAAIQ
jgi:hypothetical protein